MMFANQSKLFIPDLRELGLLSRIEEGNEAKIMAEENAIRMALRATMQAVFGGFMDGLGNGVGNMFCGIIVEAFSYIHLWQIFCGITVATFLVYQTIEITKSRWSDSYQAKKGSKASEILAMEDQVKKDRLPGKSYQSVEENTIEVDYSNISENKEKRRSSATGAC